MAECSSGPRWKAIADMRGAELPEPDLPYIQQLKRSETSNNQSAAEQQRATTPTTGKPAPRANSTPKPGTMRRESIDAPEADPWASPATQKVRTQRVSNDATPFDQTTAAQPISNGHPAPQRTTSAFTTHSDEPVQNPTNRGSSSSEALSGPTGDGWGSYDASAGGTFPGPEQPALGTEGFGTSGNDNGGTTSAGNLGRSIGGGRVTGRGIEEVVTITVLPEKEGMFMFQHRNYEVKSPRRGSTVVRRYSDFVWLLDCLHKRYPFRQLPLLPPKRVAGMCIRLLRRLFSLRPC